MELLGRNGTTVSFDASKISMAIMKALEQTASTGGLACELWNRISEIIHEVAHLFFGILETFFSRAWETMCELFVSGEIRPDLGYPPIRLLVVACGELFSAVTIADLHRKQDRGDDDGHAFNSIEIVPIVI